MLLPLPYHQAATGYCKQQQEVWRFFSNATHKEEEVKAFKTELLKNTYRFTPAGEPALYEKLTLAQQKLGLSIPVTLYQAQHTGELNASIVQAGGEAHIVFSGKLITLLNGEELLAVIAHELSHLLLYTQLNGDVEVTDRIITALGNHHNSTPAYYETARLFKLYTEIFCDRGAHQVCGTYQPVISSLVKLATGLTTIDAESYLRQADAIFEQEAGTKTAGNSHPEDFIRARAVFLWHQKDPDVNEKVQQMIEGAMSIDEMDLFHQQLLSGITEQLLHLVTLPAWMQTPLVTALARQYFPQLAKQAGVDKQQLTTAIKKLHPSLLDFLSYLLYDFTTADKELEDLPMGYCFALANEIQLTTHFAAIVKKERKLTDKQLAAFRQKTMAEYQKQGTAIV